MTECGKLITLYTYVMYVKNPCNLPEVYYFSNLLGHNHVCKGKSPDVNYVTFLIINVQYK